MFYVRINLLFVLFPFLLEHDKQRSGKDQRRQRNKGIIKLVLSTTPEDGMTGMPKHVEKQNILKLKRFIVSYCDKL
jgi:hypothetical protein